MNSREFCNQPENEHALVSPAAEVRDSLGMLAVQVLSSRENLSNLDYGTMLHKLHQIVCELHQSFDQEYPYFSS